MSSPNSPCAACKMQRRKCTQECAFAPYFPPDQPTKFTTVHKVFGASNVAKILNDLPPAQREDAVQSLVYEAESRLHDPVYGCVGYISILQHKLKQVQEEIFNAKKELATYIGPSAMHPLALPTMSNPEMLYYHQNAGPSSSSLMGQFGGGMQPMGLVMPSNNPSPQQLFIGEHQQQQQQQQQQIVEAQTQHMSALAI